MPPVLEFVRANPAVLLPVCLVASVVLYTLLKKLLKLVAIVGIAAALFVVILQYLEP